MVMDPGIVHPDHRGEAWLVMERCLYTHRHERGPLRNYFSRAWRNQRRSARRRENFERSVFRRLSEVPVPVVTGRLPVDSELDLPKLSHREFLMVRMVYSVGVGKGLYSFMANAMSCPMGTVKSRLSTLRRKLGGWDAGQV